MQEIKVLIEIPESSPVKYEFDEKSSQMTVDRLMPTAMTYPVSYGLIQNTLGEDGDALDALVFISQKVVPGVVITCKVIGLLQMEDEEGIDHKIIAVPLTKIDPVCGAWNSLKDVPPARLKTIRHFFEHYKDLEPNKWVKLKDWKSPEAALAVLKKAKLRHKSS
jgi:inorganic pyrophosphatase